MRPTIAGIAQRGNTLTSTRGTWDGVGNFYTYQWQRDGVDIAGATGISYGLTVADEGAKIRLVVTVTNPDGDGFGDQRPDRGDRLGAAGQHRAADGHAARSSAARR